MRILTVLTLLAGLAAPAFAQPLVVGIGDAVTSIDPHFLNAPTNKREYSASFAENHLGHATKPFIRGPVGRPDPDGGHRPRIEYNEVVS